ncbi:C_GCAxxG_C_C family protein [bacterium]|nr:C_GCAxxG_C_C family protein [bacterium]
MKTTEDTAAALFADGYNCAQSTFCALCERLGMDRNTALKTSCGFGGGMGRNQEVCGAVAGGIMAIGLRHGRGVNDDRPVTMAAYEKVRAFMGRFAAQHGSCLCRDLLDGVNLLTAEGQQQFKERNLHGTVCTECVRTATRLAEEAVNG